MGSFRRLLRTVVFEPKRDRWLGNGRGPKPPSLPHLQGTRKREHLCHTLAQRNRPCPALLTFHVGTRGRKNKKEEHMGSCPCSKGDLPPGPRLPSVCLGFGTNLILPPLAQCGCQEVGGQLAGADGWEATSAALGI